MEVYVPIPDELLHRTPRSLRKLWTIVMVAVLIAAAVLVLRFAFEPTPPMFRNFGVVHTVLGTAVVVCGGEVTDACGDTTALVFDSCDQVDAYFPNANNPPEVTDEGVRRLLGVKPPGGSQWAVYCGPNGMAHDRPADLKPV